MAKEVIAAGSGGRRRYDIAVSIAMSRPPRHVAHACTDAPGDADRAMRLPIDRPTGDLV
jgi:hypothetical protein